MVKVLLPTNKTNSIYQVYNYLIYAVIDSGFIVIPNIQNTNMCKYINFRKTSSMLSTKKFSIIQ